MFFEFSDRARELQDRVRSFMERHIYPNEGSFCKQRDEGDRWEPLPLMEELKEKARAEGLWNLFRRKAHTGPG